MAKRYSIRYSGYSIEMSKPSSTVLIYRIPYRDLLVKNYGFAIENPFIVYILFGKSNSGKDVVYVGKSKNGLANRPTSHADKYDDWSMCYILTQFKERTFFNDGTIQYLEDKLNKKIRELDTYHNTTETTNTGTANMTDVEDCDDYLKEAYDMLFVLGLDLYTSARKNDSTPIVVADSTTSADSGGTIIPDGEYYMTRRLKKNGNKAPKARLIVKDGQLIVPAGCEVFPIEGSGITDNIRSLRNSPDYVSNGILQKNVIFDSPSSAAMFVIGTSSNGWIDWKTDSGISIDYFRINTD